MKIEFKDGLTVNATKIEAAPIIFGDESEEMYFSITIEGLATPFNAKYILSIKEDD